MIENMAEKQHLACRCHFAQQFVTTFGTFVREFSPS